MNEHLVLFKMICICGVSLPYRSVEEICSEFSIYRNYAYYHHATYKSPDVNKSQLTPALNSPRLSFYVSQLLLSYPPLFPE